MPADSRTRDRWRHLYQDERHRLRYPSEHVIRWLTNLPPLQRRGVAVDIGCGHGRHLKPLRDAGYEPWGIDIHPPAGDPYCSAGDMTRLPFPDRMFDVALAYGVFYYTNPAGMEQAIGEMWRVLRPGGHGFVCLRGSGDWRRNHIHDGVFDLPGHPEHGMEMTLTTSSDIPRLFAAYTQIRAEWSETSTGGQQRVNSDWLIAVAK